MRCGSSYSAYAYCVSGLVVGLLYCGVSSVYCYGFCAAIGGDLIYGTIYLWGSYRSSAGCY